MITESSIDKDLIRSKIEENFNLKVNNLTFIKGGECSWGYKVDTDQGTYFLKIHTNLEEYEIRFALTYKLFNNCGIKNITHPIRTKTDQLVFSIETYPAALFNFISGSVAAEKELGDSQKVELGVLLGKIHKAKEIIGEFSIREKFSFSGKVKLLKNLEYAKNLSQSDTNSKNQVAQLMIGNSEKIFAKLKQVEDLGAKLRSENLDFVICHSEPHRWNIMVNNEGELFLIDWDDCIYAPKEKDLTMVKNDSTVLKGYKDVVGDFTLNEEVIKFYDMKWNLSEIEDWSSRLFYEDHNDIQKKHYLEQFESEIKTLSSTKN